MDARGLLHAFTIFYNWGTLRTEIAYAFINGAPVWHRLQSDVATDLPTLGHVTGEVTISLTNQCLDCTASGSRPTVPAGGIAGAGMSR